MWSNLRINPDNTSNMPYLNGGAVSLRSSSNITLNTGSTVDVSSGAAILSNGKQSGGKGGNVSLEASINNTAGKLVLAGDLKGYGVNGGGTLNVLANQVVIGSAANPTPDTLVLDGAFFNKGFSQYQITGSKGVTVSDGTQVGVSMPVYRFGGDAASTITGSNAKDGLELWTPPVYLEDAVKGVLTQRKGASLSLQAGTLTSSAADMATVQAVVGKGAVINVDPGQNISISSIGQLTVDGRLNAWGGKITLGAVGVSPTVAEAVDAAGHGRSIWIGEQAVLDVAARAVTAVALNGTRYGQVRNGGSIVVGGEINHATGIATAPNLFVVVREGALLDASGAQATLDIAGLGATRLASSGGSISLASNNGLYLDGLFKANAGGAGAAGGTLNVALETPLYPAGAATRVRAGRELVLSQGKPASALSAGSDAANVAGSLLYGHGELGADQIVAGGFDNLSLLSNGVISVDGNLSLRMGQSLNLYANALALSNAAAADTRVLLAAPYVRLSGVGAIGGADGKIRPTPLSSVSTQMATGQLQVEAGAVLDLRDNLSIGVHSDSATAPGLASLVDRRAFDRVALRSQGDLRLLGSTVNGQSTVFSSAADVSLAAAQIYPTTGAIAIVRAGYIGGNVNYDASRKLVIERTTQSDQAQPYSVFGSLTLAAAVIEQGGLVRAPMGSITLGTSGTQSTSAVHLLPGSVTTVSAAGLRLPYGGTVDGVSWLYDGTAVELLGVGGMSSNGNLKVGVTLAGKLVDVQAGALLDLSGGGELLGAAFVSGRGGSVDARYNPLLQIGSNGGFIMPGLGSNPVYAIVPGAQSVAAPAGGASDPVLGQQITIGAGVPGLAAGTYTLLPSTYALLPGAFRVELNGAAGAGGFTAAQAMRNGSWSMSGQLSIAGTGIQDVLARQFIVTSANTLRTYSQYNETSYADFVRADALRVGVPRAALEADAKTLVLRLSSGGANGIDFNFNGQTRFQAAAGGFNGTLALVKYAGGDIEILAPGVAAGSKSDMISVYANDLNAVGASRLTVGSLPWVRYGQGGNHVVFDYWDGADSVFLRQGATLAAAEVLLVSSKTNGSIEIEAGASINTLGRGKAVYNADDGFIYRPENHSVVAVSNGRLQMLAPTPGATPPAGPGQILVGQCSTGVCAGNTTLYSEGSIVFATTNTFALSDSVRYGTRHLGLAVGGINVGSDATLAAAAANNILPSGLTLNQDVLNRLLRGDVGNGIPALETLSLTAAESFNFYGDTTLSTLDANGKSLLANLVLSTPAIYGHGAAGDVARIQTGNLIWNGAATAPGAVVANGAGTGTGTLEIQAQRIEFGYGPDTQPDTIKSADRLALGFANVNLRASERITANHKGSLSVYQSQGAYDPVTGFAYSGGNLNIVTPLLTGAAGSVNRITAGGAINVSGASATTPMPGIDALGAELSLAGNSIVLDTRVVLPSGKLTLSARQDLTLTDAARIDMAGRKLMFNDVSKYSWGGDVTLESHTGNIRQASGSVIDLSAQHNQAGHLKAVAVDAAAGLIDLQGKILGSSSGYYNAGGSLVPYTAGTVDIRAQTTGDFAALNQRLNAGQVVGGRSFQLKQGDLIIGNEIKAGVVDISIDNGTLTVNGTIDASGERVGSIRLAGKHGLTIAGTAVLDTHGTKLRVDSYGKIIDSPNRAMVELNSGDGLLTLASGARIDLRHGTEVAAGNRPGQHDGQQRGTLELNAPRIGSDGLPTDTVRGTGSDAAIRGDIAIDAGGQINIEGARSIVVNATQRYDDAPVAVVKDASGNVVLGPDGKPVLDLGAGGRSYQVIDQNYLNQKHGQSTDFITAALGNAGLMNGKLAGLNNARYADAFHLRPGVEIVTAGDLVISGDLDLSAYRYAGVNPHAQKTGVYGSGEPGNLVIRAGRNLDIYGSINDGFAPPPPTPDDNGWVLTPGRQAYGGDVVVPGPGVVLADGTLFPDGKTLNYALPIQATTLAGGTVLPVQAELTAALTLPANTVLRAAVRDQAGNLVYAAGTILGAAVTLNTGMRLDAGTLLPQAASLAALTWPAGVPLPGRASFDNYYDPNGVRLAGPLALKIGALIPSETNVKLPDGALSVPLRTVTGGIQGRNWAVAPMLAEGSLSWSLRLVSGADTQAADTRAIKPVLLGDLTLADTHYALYETHDKTIIPGTPARPGGLLYWGEVAALFGFVPGTLVAPGDEVNCGDEGVCIRVNYVWGEFAFLYGENRIEGTPVAAADEKDCDPDMCTPVGKAIPGTPDQVIIGKLNKVSPITTHFSVLRTGTGDLDLVAAGNLQLQSPYGVYTAGTSTSSLAGAQAGGFNQARSRSSDGVTVLGSGGTAYENIVNAGGAYAAWYPDHGGNLLLRTGGSVTGDIFGQLRDPADQNARMQKPNSEVGNWLWRQGTGTTAGVDNIPTSWWINFGTYVKEAGSTNSGYADKDIIDKLPMLIGFTGFGTLGGGNLTLDAGTDAGMLSRRGSSTSTSPRSQGLLLTVGSTGRVVAGGELLLTGGGDLDVRVGGSLNPSLSARAVPYVASAETARYDVQDLSLNGVVSNLRGTVNLQTGSLGGIALNYGSRSGNNDSRESRAFDPFNATLGTATGGMVLMLGDAAANLSVRGDLVLAGSGDPGRVYQLNTSAYQYQGTRYDSGGYGWFSLWTDNTAINLFAAGGNLTPSVQMTDMNTVRNFSKTDGRFLLPSQLHTVAANGSIYLGNSALGERGASDIAYSILLAPGSNGSLEMLAGNSIYAGGYAVNQSGAGRDVTPTPLTPAFMGMKSDARSEVRVSNLGIDAIGASTNSFSLFAFGADTIASRSGVSSDPARIYAINGDIVGVRSGEILSFSSGQRAGQTWYEAAGPVWMMAGRDIVNSGTALGQATTAPRELVATLTSPFGAAASSRGNLFVHHNPGDVSLVLAGRDILQSSFNVAGPGTLEISAGRNIRMDDKASVTSLGPVLSGDGRAGASIAILAGAGSSGPDYAGLITRYLNPANLAQAGIPLAEQAGKVAKTYEKEMAAWLSERYGFTGSVEQAQAYFSALPAEQQRVFGRQIYFAELQAGGREFNDANSTRFGSYLRGRNVIATLFGAAATTGYRGDFTMYGSAGINTLFGGDIQLLTPGGQQVFGTEGATPVSVNGVIPGVITQGAGNIQLYARDSILLGQSRVMTTFGGSILGWSAAGDINAGRGSKSTVVYTPPKRVYDQWGNVTLSSDVPSTGAGIATLAPIPEVPAGDIDLIAPLGTIDAGEAGIRVSGNVNLAALQVVNAANIQVKGESRGMPAMVAVNVGALSNASAAASSASAAAQESVQRARNEARQALPSVVTVKVLGFGSEGAGAAPLAPGAYNWNSPVQVLGQGGAGARQNSQLTDGEKRLLGL
ncbi:filamentous haemagglutinin family protein [Herbaspirillum autotrophicum]|uniref:filamentous haemagglutinin family protein n=1 Tax=Herbaspirillum autotrophicum TaxID=180195 RepID=UPI001E37708E|nr:filamentous haemagglutinin family protein [Herbaspirillum autotrophicum]